MTISYYINGVNFTTDSVYVSQSTGLIGALKMREPVKQVWPDHHGEVMDLAAPRFESRTIRLDCFMKATSKEDFLTKVKTFLERFQQAGLQRLMVVVDTTKPLVFQVYLSEETTVSKTWSDTQMTGTFTLVLREPEPVKKVYKYISASGSMTVTMTVTSADPVNIYWGDGTVTYDVTTASGQQSHTYATEATNYIVISGIIENITGVTTTATLVWSKL